MTNKEKKTIDGIVTRTRLALQGAGFQGALIVGKDASELRDSIKRTWLGLLTNADLDELKAATERMEEIKKLRKATAPKPEHQQLYLF